MRWALLVICLGSLAGVGSAAWAQGDDPSRFLDPADVPLTGEYPEMFQPDGWIIEAVVPGELTGDQFPDMVVTLVEDLLPQEGGIPVERYKALVMLQGTESGYTLAGVGPRALRCSTCYGMLGGPDGGWPEIEIQGNVVVIDDLFGSRDAQNLVLKYRWDADRQAFRLIGRDSNYTDRLTLESTYESTNYLTGLTIIEHVTIDEQTEEEHTTTERIEGEPQVILLQDVDNDSLSMPLSMQ